MSGHGERVQALAATHATHVRVSLRWRGGVRSTEDRGSVGAGVDERRRVLGAVGEDVMEREVEEHRQQQRDSLSKGGVELQELVEGA